jgi:hypothetical protein
MARPLADGREDAHVTAATVGGGGYYDIQEVDNDTEAATMNILQVVKVMMIGMMMMMMMMMMI